MGMLEWWCLRFLKVNGLSQACLSYKIYQGRKKLTGVLNDREDGLAGLFDVGNQWKM